MPLPTQNPVPSTQVSTKVTYSPAPFLSGSSLSTPVGLHPPNVPPFAHFRSLPIFLDHYPGDLFLLLPVVHPILGMENLELIPWRRRLHPWKQPQEEVTGTLGFKGSCRRLRAPRMFAGSTLDLGTSFYGLEICSFVPEAKVHGYSMERKSLWSAGIGGNNLTLNLTLEWGLLLLCTALSCCWEPRETLRRSPGKGPKGSSGLLFSALWPHGGATTLLSYSHSQWRG